MSSPESITIPPHPRYDTEIVSQIDALPSIPDPEIPVDVTTGFPVEYPSVKLPPGQDGQPLATEGAGESMSTNPTKDEYVQYALQNLRATSRTASGVIDTSASTTKADMMVEGLDSETIADTATQNFTQTIENLFDAREAPIESPADLRDLVEAVAKQVNGGLLKEGQLIRSGADSDKYAYTRLDDLEASMDEFYDTFFEKLSDPETDPIDLAGWVEYRIDLTDHFFADGCGKSAKAASAWVLMRAGLPLPTYRGRDELYAHAPSTIRQEGSEQTATEQDAWLQYYRTLF